MATETREVKNFDRVVLAAYGELKIGQGDRESLTIEADEQILSKIVTQVSDGKLTIDMGGDLLDKLGSMLNTALSGRRVVYDLTVRELAGLAISGASSVRASAIRTDRLELGLSGAGRIDMGPLTAEQLVVNLPGAGQIHLSGQAREQQVTIGGAGTYRAPKLESQRATIDLKGVGTAIVWTTGELEVTIRGAGHVEYYGSPQVKQKVSGIGRLTQLSTP